VERVALHRCEDVRQPDGLEEDLRRREPHAVDPAARRHHHHRDVPEQLVPELRLPELPPAHLRHHQIEQDEARPDAGAEEVERGPAVLEEADRVALLGEQLAEGLAEIEIVIHDEDRGRVAHARLRECTRGTGSMRIPVGARPHCDGVARRESLAGGRCEGEDHARHPPRASRRDADLRLVEQPGAVGKARRRDEERDREPGPGDGGRASSFAASAARERAIRASWPRWKPRSAGFPTRRQGGSHRDVAPDRAASSDRVDPAFASAKSGMTPNATHGWSARSKRASGASAPSPRAGIASPRATPAMVAWMPAWWRAIQRRTPAADQAAALRIRTRAMSASAAPAAVAAARPAGCKPAP
jgi:hypothetical protein